MSEAMLELIRDLQSMEVLLPFSLAGGTNLAVRFNHRRSDDIDLFANTIIGIKGWEAIGEALRLKYEDALLFCNIVNKNLGDQFCFLRAMIIKGEEQIKIDLIQNIQHLDTVENVDGMRLYSVRDIALFKLMAASNRFQRMPIFRSLKSLSKMRISAAEIVRDAASGGPITVRLNGKGIATMTNEKGQFIFKIPAVGQNDSLSVTHVGFTPPQDCCQTRRVSRTGKSVQSIA